MALRDQLLGTEGLGCLVGRGAGGRQETSGAESPQTEKVPGEGACIGAGVEGQGGSPGVGLPAQSLGDIWLAPPPRPDHDVLWAPDDLNFPRALAQRGHEGSLEPYLGGHACVFGGSRSAVLGTIVSLSGEGEP